ncbi:hypothetical protein GW17_00001530 [Ensete ventricosum]|nr:hypothetical protein GW17_00001530 [Ensete ventricosum]
MLDRYQVLAGVIEQRILEPLLHNQKLALSALCFAVRTGNTFLGSLLFDGLRVGPPHISSQFVYMSRENSKEGFLRRPGNNLRPVLGIYKSTRCRGSNQRDRIGPFFIVPLGTRVGEGAWEEGRSPPEVVIAMEETLAEQEDRNLNSDSSSSSSDDDDEAAEDLRIKTLEKSLAKNPFDYDTNGLYALWWASSPCLDRFRSLVQYIQCLRKFGRLKQLRQARESMNERFPLSSEMWQEWIKDEVSLCTR